MLEAEKRDIELRVNTLKNLIDDIRLGKSYCLNSDNKVSLRVVKINPGDIPNFENYPYDYQYFVSVIGGEIDLGFGCGMLNIIMPELYDPEILDGDYHEKLSMIHGDFSKNSLLVASHPCDNDTLAFDESTIPYTAINGWGETDESFLVFVERQFLRLPENLSYDVTSNGVPFSEVPEYARSKVEWIEGLHYFSGPLPSLEEYPVPDVLMQMPVLHPDRPTGSRAMLCASGAKGRLVGLRAGAWTVTPFNNWRYAVFPNDQVGWIPNEIVLPEALFIPYRDGR